MSDVKEVLPIKTQWLPCDPIELGSKLQNSSYTCSVYLHKCTEFLTTTNSTG